MIQSSGGLLPAFPPSVQVGAARVEALSALGDPTRRSIFERLVDGPHAVGDIARDLPVSRPAVSQHLRVLKAAGLVVDQRVGNRRLYRVDPAGLGVLRAWLDRFPRPGVGIDTGYRPARMEPVPTG